MVSRFASPVPSSIVATAVGCRVEVPKLRKFLAFAAGVTRKSLAAKLLLTKGEMRTNRPQFGSSAVLDLTSQKSTPTSSAWPRDDKLPRYPTFSLCAQQEVVADG